MSHFVIARKYRPSNFGEVIGQDSATQTLSNAILNGKIAHAYLFSGPRGVGKTTTARIMAKAVNCEKYPSREPCNKCASCIEINAGSALDIIEIDAASNRGIDDIKNLRENVAFAPASSRYKVYVIDEAHQITADAFNALLKTLEEPPPYIIFILATTAPEKVPATILSRCQHFKFRLVRDEEIKMNLKKISSAEKVKITNEALDLICDEAAGSPRDAQSVLEQAISASQKEEIGARQIEFILGLVEAKKIDEILNAVSKKDIKSAFKIIDKIYKGGYSLQQFTRKILMKLRKILASKIAGEKTGLFEDASSDRIYWMLECLCSAEREMKWSEFPKIILELCVYKISSDFISIEEAIAAAPASYADEDEVSRQEEKEKPVEEEKNHNGKAPSKILELLENKCGAVGQLFRLAQKISPESGSLYCEFGASNELQAKRIIANSEIIEKVLHENGYALTLDVAIVMPKGGGQTPAEKITEAKQLEIEEPIITKLHAIVGGELEGPADE